jgi:hypothetical protein
LDDDDDDLSLYLCPYAFKKGEGGRDGTAIS